MSEAYKWLQTLPASVREDLKSMEQVVSLYLRAKRLGGQIPPQELEATLGAKKEAPAKTPQDFQKTLKELQFELQQFDMGPGQTPGPQAMQQMPLVAPQTHTGVRGNGPSVGAGAAAQAAPIAPSGTESIGPGAGAPQAAASGPLAALRLDPKSRHLINEIREGLNLSSDQEVIRMSLVLAHKSLKELLK